MEYTKIKFFCIYFDMFETQSKRFCNCHCNALALIFCDCVIMQSFDFSFFKRKRKPAMFTVKVLFFLCESQNKSKLIPLCSFYFHILFPVIVSVTAHHWGSPWLKSRAVDHLFSYILEKAFLLFLSPPPSVGLVL